MFILSLIKRLCKNHQNGVDMKVLILGIIIALLCSCNSKGIHLPANPVITYPVTPISLTGGTVKINLTDYFPDLSLLKKITGSKNMEIVYESETPTLYLIPEKNIFPLANLRFRYEGFNYDIPLLKNSGSPKDSPLIFTDEIRGDTIFLRSDRPVEKWAVYIQNYKLRDRFLLPDSARLGIILPIETTQLKKSTLRVWAANTSGVSNDVFIPLAGKQVVLDVHSLDSIYGQIYNPTHSQQDIDTIINITAGQIFSRQGGKLTRLHQLLSENLRQYGIHNNKRYILTNSQNKIPGFQISDSSIYNKLLQLWTFHITIPGIPEICQADSLKIPGNIPNDDRMVRQKITQLNELCNEMPLIYGDFIPLRIEDEVYAYIRSYFGEEIIVVFNKSREPVTLKLDLPDIHRKENFKALFDNRFSYDNARLLLDVPALGVEVIYN